ncbi:MAG: SpoIIE family protein phosphatase [Hydrogeniiclostridium mannosilyticum]
MPAWTAALQGLLASTIGKANASIFAASQENKTLRGMGTTIVAAVVVNGSYYIAYAGDSRAYLVRQGISRQLTTDHSMVQEMVDNGDLTEQEAKFHPHKNIITRVLGVNPDIKVDYREACLESGDILLLCTDGLTNYVDEEIMGSECDGKTLEEYCNALIESAKNGGGGDNITVVAMRF